MPVFESASDVADWLRLQSHETAAAFSLRAALRVIPALESGETFWSKKAGDGRDIVQAAFENASAAFSYLISNRKPALDGGSGLDAQDGHTAQLKLYVEQSEIMSVVKDYDFVASAQAALSCSLTRYATVKTDADATASATEAVVAALEAASHAHTGYRTTPSEALTLLLACAADSQLIEDGLSVSDLLSLPLWTTAKPAWTESSWGRLKDYIRSKHMDLDAWIDWYEQRLLGSAPRPSGGLSDEEPKSPANPAGEGVAEEGPAFSAPELTMRPAMIEPVWRGNRLTPSDDGPVFDLGDGAFRDFLSVLQEEMSSLAKNLAEDSNCDPRIIGALMEMAAWMADAEPTRRLVFKLGHAKERLESEQSAIVGEWPATYSAQYKAIVLQLDRMLSRCESWRAFTQTDQPITDQQARQGAILAASLAESFEGEEGAGIVDPSISEALRDLSAESKDALIGLGLSHSRARDGLESFSNCLKRLVSKLAEVARPASFWAEDAAKRSGKSFADGVENRLATEAEQEGDRLGRVIWRVLVVVVRLARPLLENLALGYAYSFFDYLANQLPMLSWLKDFTAWLHSL